jgi:transcriptional regulator with XRE-family HTH domain
VQRQAELYNKAQILMDATSVGDPIYQALKGAKLNIAGLKFTNQSKRELIDGFALELEQGNRGLNGLGLQARNWIDILQRLTVQPDLSPLTMVPYKNALPAKGLVRRTGAWCSRCYQEWQDGGKPVHDPLLWNLQEVLICPRHHQQLHVRCFHRDCGSFFPPLKLSTPPGYCGSCKRWLGSPLAGFRRGVTSNQDLRRLERRAVMIGELLATPLTRRLAQKQIVDVISLFCEDDGPHQSLSEVARTLDVHRRTLSMWLYKGTQPTLGSLLSLCERFDVSLVQLLTCEPSTVAGLMRDAATPSPRVNRASARKRQHFDTDGARRSLECILAAEELPPPSMREVARRLGHDQRRLQHKLPDLHHRISARYLEYRSENSRSSA